MQLTEINTLEELQAERRRLQLEAETAKAYLLPQSNQMLHHSKTLVSKKLSWSSILRALAFYGGKHLLSATAKKHLHNGNGHTPISPFVEGLSYSLELMTSDKPQPWQKVIPTLIDLFVKGNSTK